MSPLLIVVLIVVPLWAVGLVVAWAVVAGAERATRQTRKEVIRTAAQPRTRKAAHE